MLHLLHLILVMKNEERTVATKDTCNITVDIYLKEYTTTGLMEVVKGKVATVQSGTSYGSIRYINRYR